MTCYTYSRRDNIIKDELNQYVSLHFKQKPTHVENKDDAKTHWTKTCFATLIESLEQGDVIITNEANQLGCSIVQLIEILEILNKKQVDIHFVKSLGDIFPAACSVKWYCFCSYPVACSGVVDYEIAMKNAEPNVQRLLTLISMIEREFISSRTVVALSRRRAQGLPLGRPKGSINRTLKLDQFRIEIERYLGLGISKASIAKLVDCHPQTLYDWIERGRDRPVAR